ncbi:MAG: hypothetical protein ACRDQV_16325 [Pseudonocardiaceae bacterium]
MERTLVAAAEDAEEQPFGVARDADQAVSQGGDHGFAVTDTPAGQVAGGEVLGCGELV